MSLNHSAHTSTPLVSNQILRAFLYTLPQLQLFNQLLSEEVLPVDWVGEEWQIKLEAGQD